MNDHTANAFDYEAWYQDQVIFLTGATGNLGGSLLYKLSLQLPTKKIYVLCRASVGRAIEEWERCLPQIDDILDTGKVQLVVGGMRQPGLGLDQAHLQQLCAEVTVVINAAGAVSVAEDNLSESIRDNCLGNVTLADMAAKFIRLRMFVHISTVLVNVFHPGALVMEQIYNLPDENADFEQELSSIVTTGKSNYVGQFPYHYPLAKYLTERLLQDNLRPFPVLIVRPSSISPAIQDPYPIYGSDEAIPLHATVFHLLGSPTNGPYQLLNKLPQDEVCDEIPVDMAANVTLLHIDAGTEGVIHAAADTWGVTYTLPKLLSLAEQHIPPATKSRMRTLCFKQQDHLQEKLVENIQLYSRHWRFDCSRTEHLKCHNGRLSIVVPRDVVDEYIRRRMTRLSRGIESRMEQAEKHAAALGYL